jgi:hypothetical protein
LRAAGSHQPTAAELHDEGEYHTIEIDEELGAVLFTWEAYDSGEPFRNSLSRLHEVLAERDMERYLIDDGVRAGASVDPESAVADMDMDEIENSVNAIADGYTFKGFTDPEEARSWLARQ